MESPTVGTLPEGHTAQVSVEASEEVALTTPSLTVEVPVEITPPEAPVASLALAVSMVSTTLAPKEPACTPFFTIERGSGSTSGDDTMDFLTRKTVQQFLDAMRS